MELLNVLATQVSVLVDTIGSMLSSPAQVMSLLVSEQEEQIESSLRSIGMREQHFTPILIELVRVGGEFEQLPRFLHDAIAEEIDSQTVVLQSGTLLILLAPDDGTDPAGIGDRVRVWAEKLLDSIGMVSNVGIGTGTSRTRSPLASFTEARSALDWARFSSTRRELSLVNFDEVREVQGLPALVCALAPRLAQRRAQLEPLRDYDRRHGTELLDTLSAFAEHGGSMATTSDAIFIHRNTLRQRLGRIEQILNISLSETQNWPEMLLAANLTKSH